MRRLSRIPAPLWPSLQCQHSLFKKLSGSLEKNTSNHKINKLFDKIKNQSGIKQPLTWYSCGPTIYDHAHIGHARTYVCTDIIRRILEDYFQINVRFAMGMTDIDDKIITKGIEKGFKNWSEYLPMLHQFEDSFFSDLDALNVRRPDAVLRVTNHVEDIIRFISKLEQLGFAYSTSHGVYFDVKKLGSSYGKLGSIPPAESEETESEDVSNINNSSNDNNTDNISSNSSSSAHTTSKRHWRDFALWKTNKLGEPTWSSPWGSGRPGWHIECSAMTHAYFGDRLDIHSGGIDLKFPHHTNEIAQR